MTINCIVLYCIVCLPSFEALSISVRKSYCSLIGLWLGQIQYRSDHPIVGSGGFGKGAVEVYQNVA